MRECVRIQPRLSTTELIALTSKFAETELCPCALEEFQHQVSEHLGRNNDVMDIESIKDALFCGIINEMVVRSLATKVTTQSAE